MARESNLKPVETTSRYARTAAAGFLFGGVLMGVPGALMVAWRYQLDSDPREIGAHFLAFNGALLLASLPTQWLLKRLPVKLLACLACLISCAAFTSLAFAAPPLHPLWRLVGLIVLGCSAGMLITSLFHFVRPLYEKRAAATINTGGLMFGMGALLATMLINGAYYIYPVQWAVISLAALPLLLLALFVVRFPFRAKLRDDADARIHPRALRDFRTLAAVLFSILLFFQFGNEWALASWLPLFLIHRLGMGPGAAIFVLSLYFLALMVGRLIVRLVLPRVSHPRLLFGSVLVAMVGYLLLSLTDTALGAALATVLTGLAFAPIYALVAEKMGRRFDYQPGFFNGIFSLAITGGMLMPALLGFVGYIFGMKWVLVVPALGSVAVLALMLLIMLEAKLMGVDVEPSGGKNAGPLGEHKAMSAQAGK